MIDDWNVLCSIINAAILISNSFVFESRDEVNVLAVSSNVLMVDDSDNCITDVHTIYRVLIGFFMSCCGRNICFYICTTNFTKSKYTFRRTWLHPCKLLLPCRSVTLGVAFPPFW